MRTYLKAFLFLALTASIACAGANFAQAAEAAPAASAGNGMMPPVGTFDNNAAYQALTPEKQANTMKSSNRRKKPCCPSVKR